MHARSICTYLLQMPGGSSSLPSYILVISSDRCGSQEAAQAVAGSYSGRIQIQMQAGAPHSFRQGPVQIQEGVAIPYV